MGTNIKQLTSQYVRDSHPTHDHTGPAETNFEHPHKRVRATEACLREIQAV